MMKDAGSRMMDAGRWMQCTGKSAGVGVCGAFSGVLECGSEVAFVDQEFGVQDGTTGCTADGVVAECHE